MHRIPRRRPRAPEPSKKFVFRLIKHPCSAEEKARYDNLGCKPRGRRCDGYFNHKTGKGWVAGHRGHYDDALRVKKNIVCILLHETSSGFSPPSATKIRRMGRAALSGVDRTPYTTRHKKKSFVTYHTQRISKNIVHCDSTRDCDARENLRCQG